MGRRAASAVTRCMSRAHGARVRACESACESACVREYVRACACLCACACVQMCACACMRAYVWVHARVYMAASARSPACLPLLLQANEFLSATRTVLEEEQQQALAAVIAPYSRCPYLIRLISTLGRAFKCADSNWPPKAWISIPHSDDQRFAIFGPLPLLAASVLVRARRCMGPYSRP